MTVRQAEARRRTCPRAAPRSDLERRQHAVAPALVGRAALLDRVLRPGQRRDARFLHRRRRSRRRHGPGTARRAPRAPRCRARSRDASRPCRSVFDIENSSMPTSRAPSARGSSAAAPVEDEVAVREVVQHPGARALAPTATASSKTPSGRTPPSGSTESSGTTPPSGARRRRTPRRAAERDVPRGGERDGRAVVGIAGIGQHDRARRARRRPARTPSGRSSFPAGRRPRAPDRRADAVHLARSAPRSPPSAQAARERRVAVHVVALRAASSSAATTCSGGRPPDCRGRGRRAARRSTPPRRRPARAAREVLLRQTLEPLGRAPQAATLRGGRSPLGAARRQAEHDVLDDASAKRDVVTPRARNQSQTRVTSRSGADAPDVSRPSRRPSSQRSSISVSSSIRCASTPAARATSTSRFEFEQLREPITSSRSTSPSSSFTAHWRFVVA